MASRIPYSALWGFFVSRPEYDPAHAQEVQLDIYRQIVDVMPSLGAGDMVELMQDAPEQAQEDMWEKWAARADVRGCALGEWHKTTKGLSPGVLVIVWTLWLSQNDVSEYSLRIQNKITRELPRSVLDKIAGVRPIRLLE